MFVELALNLPAMSPNLALPSTRISQRKGGLHLEIRVEADTGATDTNFNFKRSRNANQNWLLTHRSAQESWAV